MIVALLMSAATASACDHATTNAELQSALSASETAFRSMDLAAFQAAWKATSETLACEGETVSTLDAARYHRAAGLAAFFGRDVQSAQRAFAAARALEPGFVWDPAAAPAGGPVQLAYATLSIENPQRNNFPRPDYGSVRIDGKEAESRPAGWPAVVQVFTATGSVQSTAWLRPDEAMPAFASAPLASASSSTATTSTTTAKKSGLRALLIGAGVAAAGAAALYGGAFAVKADYNDSADYHEMETLKGTNQTLFWASIGLAGAAVASGTVGLVVTSF
jgi:hypothetical protein